MSAIRWAVRRVVLLVLFLGLTMAAVPAPTASAAPTWQYVALGDSLAAGFFAFAGYVPRYAFYATVDNRATVETANLGVPGWTSGQLLAALRADPAFRAAVANAEIVTWDIGGNDLLDARGVYKRGDGSCGGADNQDCLRAAVASFKGNWNGIVAEILALRSTRDAAIRTMDIYNPYVARDQAADSWQDDGGKSDFAVFKPYLDAVNAHIAATATAKHIPYARVYQAFNGPTGDVDAGDRGYLSFDRLHPNDRGHRVIADQFRALGYAPLRR